MTRRTRYLGVVLCLLFAAIVAGCPGDRVSRSTGEAVDDSLLANKVTLVLYSDKQVSGRQIAVEASQGVVQLSGVMASTAEAQRAVQIAQQVKGVKAIHNRLRVQEGRPEPAPRTSSSSGKTRQYARGRGERRTRMACSAASAQDLTPPLSSLRVREVPHNVSRGEVEDADGAEVDRHGPRAGDRWACGPGPGL